jgi:hypothetical protein
MDIKNAKNTIKNTIQAYLKKDEYGQYVIPRDRQRPILLLGAPGIGKTAIMEQIAHDLGVGLVAYSITHHTRQSALGLPFIVDRRYGGIETKITEYTMSEIIAAVYTEIENNDHKSGILFIDEINCASETLAPTMLQFLQNKTFGTHRVPEGWIIVGAGNPPEYNKSVKEFDIVTMDRVKKIDVEPDHKIWKEYAYLRQMHNAIITFVDAFPKNFYFAETQVDGLKIVTPRGWEDLSYIIKMYEELKLTIDKELIQQYVQNPKVATDFLNYYNLFVKYRKTYDINKIINGTYSLTEYSTMKSMRIDEKMAVEGMLIEHLSGRFVDYINQRGITKRLFQILKNYKRDVLTTSKPLTKFNEDFFEASRKVLNEKSKNVEREERQEMLGTISELNGFTETLKRSNPVDTNESFSIVKDRFDKRVIELTKTGNDLNEALTNVFEFIVGVFGEGSELIVLITELTINPYSVQFLTENRNDAYFKYNKNILVGEKSAEIIKDIEALNLDLNA